MKFANAIQSLVLSCMLGSTVGAVEMGSISNLSESNTSYPIHRRLQTEACTLLLKITTYEDGHEEQQVECYDEETKTYSKVESESSSGNIQSELLDKFNRGELQSGESTILQNGAFFQDGSLILSSAAKAEFGYNPHPKGRRLAISGERTYLAVRIIGADRATTASASVISDEWFGTNGDAVNYKSQIEACSYNQVTVKPYSNLGITNGVVTVTIPNTISGEDNGVIRDAAESAVNKLNLSGDIDHTMLCIPPDTKEGWIGYAYFNWDLSVYNDNWCLYPSIQMHEIGHNWDLNHSSQGSNVYGDQSGMMGYSYSNDSTKMCFNAPKNRQLGWYSDKTIRVTSGWSGRLYGISSYKSAETNDAVILYIPAGTNGSEDDYYVSFNGASGINSGTREGANKVLVHTRSSGTSRAYSYLDRQISSGFSYTDAPLEITVNTIFGSTYAQVTVGAAAPSPTPPVNCQDSPIGWFDSDGQTYNCGWYSTGGNCEKYGDAYRGQGGKTANEACCACGGGTTSNDPSPPTPRPTQSPTKAPTEPPIISDSPCSTDFGLLFKWNSTTTVTCDWVRQSPSTRCYKRKAKSICPNACSSTAFWCNEDGRGKFQLTASQNTMKGCVWVRRNPDAVAKRCSKGQVALVCRGTCEGL